MPFDDRFQSVIESAAEKCCYWQSLVDDEVNRQMNLIDIGPFCGDDTVAITIVRMAIHEVGFQLAVRGEYGDGFLSWFPQPMAWDWYTPSAEDSRRRQRAIREKLTEILTSAVQRRIRREFNAAIRLADNRVHTSSERRPDTEPDTVKKIERKKRPLSSAAAACAMHVRKELSREPDQARIRIVKDWCESKNMQWMGENLSPVGIDRILQDHPDQWKPTSSTA